MHAILRTAVLWMALSTFPALLLAEPVHLRGSFIKLEQPPGFAESPTIPGLIWEAGKAAVITTELPADAFPALGSAILDGESDGAGQEIELATAERTTISGFPAIKAQGRQRVGVGTFEKWIVLINKPDATLLVTAQLPTLFASDTRKAQIVAVLDSIEVAAIRKNPLDSLAFDFAETERFKLARVLSAHAVILTDSETVEDPKQRALFVIGTGGEPDCTLWATTGKQAFAEMLLQRLRSVKDLEALATKPAAFGTNDGFRTETHGQVNGQRAIVMQTVRFDGCRFARTIGIGPAVREALYRQEFETLAAGITWKSP